MENRRKFCAKVGRSGKLEELWAFDTYEERYNRICGVLEAYANGFLNRQDVDFAIKNAFVSKIYVSCGVVEAHPLGNDTQTLFGKTYYPLYEKLVTQGEFVLPLQQPSDLDHFKICDVSDNKKINPRINVEHTVPGKVYMDDVIQKYENNSFTFNTFKRIFDVISICLVTKDENDNLNKKGLRARMAFDNNLENYIDNPFARYKAAEVKIWKHYESK